MRVKNNWLFRLTFFAVVIATALLMPLTAYALSADCGVAFVFTENNEVSHEKIVATVLNDENASIESADLIYSENEILKTVEADNINGNAALFVVPMQPGATIELVSQNYRLVNAGSAVTVSLKSDSGTISCAYTDANANGSNVESAVAQVNDFEGESSNGVADALQSQLINQNSVATFSLNSERHSLVIALDPGHGGWDPGACAFGLREKDLTLRIAQYCKQYLEQYPGVQIYMTRNSDVSPSGTNDTTADLQARVNNSIANGADAIVSIHINSADASAHGCEVWYPNNSSWANEETHGVGGQLASSIEDKLASLGLYKRGIFSRDYPSTSTNSQAHYADGSLADYYGILRYARQQKVPAIIVEHAFVTNQEDANKLADDSWLKKMGQADALGIAEAYGLRMNGSWHLDSNGWWYSIDGECVYGWYMVNGTWYYSDASGYAVTGFQQIGDSKYYFDGSCAMLRGWQQLDGVWYNFGVSGVAKTGWNNIDGTWYYFNDDGTMATGWLFEGGHWYYLASTGAMCTGWLHEGDAWYFLEPSGATVVNNWINSNGTWYWFNASGKMVTGWALIDGSWYYFNANGSMATGWVRLSDTWYYLSSNGSMQTGWTILGGVWYYFSESGAMAQDGYAWDGSSFSTFNDTGAWTGYAPTGWNHIEGNWYWIVSGGRPETGWRYLGGAWYWFEPDSGRMLTGRYQADDCYYFSNSSGAMQVGWILNGDDWYYAESSGALLTGWLSLGSTWYWLGSDNAMATGWFEVNGVWYFANSDGSMVTGWQFINGKYEFFEESGAWDQSKTQSLMPILKANVDDYTAQMVAAFEQSGAVYPEDVYAAGGAGTIEEFCAIIQQEASDENVDPRVLFCQMMKETGWLKFGGQVSIDQYNFGGLGALDDGSSGASFVSVREGIRAQVQHLVAYADVNASVNSLAHAVVDPRFGLVNKGSAPYVQWLGVNENPSHSGWATGKNYGLSLAAMVDLYF